MLFQALVPDVEFRLFQLLQEADRCCRVLARRYRDGVLTSIQVPPPLQTEQAAARRHQQRVQAAECRPPVIAPFLRSQPRRFISHPALQIRLLQQQHLPRPRHVQSASAEQQHHRPRPYSPLPRRRSRRAPPSCNALRCSR
jgi:hypothetical protein